MHLPTPYYEDCADFVTGALICAECSHTMIVVGPVPPDATCVACSSIRLTCVPAMSQPHASPPPELSS